MANHKKQFCPKGHDTFITGRLHGGCRVCNKERSRQRTKEHPELTRAAVKRWADANKEHRKDRAYKRIYGLSLADYYKMYKIQNGICPICKNQFETLVVEHNHDTGKVRGLTCSTCNRAMGLFQDDPIKLRSAIEYLEQTA